MKEILNKLVMAHTQFMNVTIKGAESITYGNGVAYLSQAINELNKLAMNAESEEQEKVSEEPEEESEEQEKENE